MKFANFAALSSVSAFYLSSWAPNKLSEGHQIDLYFNKIFSDATQLPFAYVDVPFYCHPDKLQYDTLNLGQIFSGDRIVKSGIQFTVMKDESCVVLCSTLTPLSEQDVDLAKQLIQEDYRVEWILDGLPGAVEDPIEAGRFEPGFHLGYMFQDSDFYLNNHLDIRISYQKLDNGELLITRFHVEPRSVDIEKCSDGALINPPELKLRYKMGRKVTYTYSVKWVEDTSTTWEQRWDIYIDSSNAQIHWYSIINSLMLLVVLTVIVAFIMLATLRRDIAAYNNNDVEDSHDDIVGWKMVHGDVFRPPRRIGHLAALLGCGLQILMSSVLTLLFALFGVLNPSYRGGMISYALFFWAFAGIFAGYYSARVLKAFKGKASWQLNAFWTATIFPLILFVVLCILNTFHWALKSSLALPAGTFAALLAMWLFISVPLCLFGAYFGHKKDAIEHPVRTHQIPRQIPEQSIYFQRLPSVLIGGVVPFTVIFMELFFIMKSMWQDQYYYMFGFLAVVFLLLVITCIEVTLVMIYFNLCGEDYRWQWKSFMISSSSTWYILAFGVMSYFTKSQVVHNYMAGVMFFSYLLIGLSMYFLLTGTLGFWATYAFLRKIYGSIKID